MKRWLAVGLAALFLITSAQAGNLYKIRPRTVSSGVLTVTLTDCNSVQIRETETSGLSFSGESALYMTSLGETEAVIQQHREDDGAKYNPPVLEVPAGRYSEVRVEAVDSGLSVCPSGADYSLHVKEGAVGIHMGSGYLGKVTADVEDSACSVSFFGGEPENLRLTARTDDCAVDAPKDWNWRWGADEFTKTWGAGAGLLDLTATDCALSIHVDSTKADSTKEDLAKADSAGESRYQDAPGVANMLKVSSGEMAVSDPGDPEGGFYFNGDGQNIWENLRARSTPNTETALKTIPAKGVSTLQVNAQFFGVAVELSESEEFELSYVGADDVKSVNVETEVQNGTLTVTCTGLPGGERYINTSPDFRVNTVRVGVPAGVLKEIRVDCGAGSVLVNGVDVPVSGVGTSGMTRVTGEARTEAVVLSTRSGSAAVQCGTVSAPVTLSSINGSAYLKADTVTGKADLSAVNGSVYAGADRLEEASLQATNGSVRAEVGTVGRHVSAGVANGSLTVDLTRPPRDLTFRLSGGQRGGYGPELPDGWKDGYTVGSGEPILELSAAPNGMIHFTVSGK